MKESGLRWDQYEHNDYMKYLHALMFLLLSTCKPVKSGGNKPVIDKNGKEWPECIPPDPNDPNGEFNNNLTVNGTPYFCTAEGRWEVDQKVVEYKRERENKQRDLLSALSQRKLSHAELLEVTPDLNVFEMQGYFACVKYAELYDLLVKQWEIQTGTQLPFKVQLSRSLGEYNRCPQEHDNKRAVEEMIDVLRNIKGT